MADTPSSHRLPFPEFHQLSSGSDAIPGIGACHSMAGMAWHQESARMSSWSDAIPGIAPKATSAGSSTSGGDVSGHGLFKFCGDEDQHAGADDLQPVHRR